MSVYIQLPDNFDISRFKSIIERMTRNQSGFERPLKQKPVASTTASSTLETNKKKQIMKDQTIKQVQPQDIAPAPVIESDPVPVPVPPGKRPIPAPRSA